VIETIDSFRIYIRDQEIVCGRTLKSLILLCFCVCYIILFPVVIICVFFKWFDKVFF
jgi:hypothetical protein